MVFKIKKANADPYRLAQRMAGFYGITSDRFKEQGLDHVKCAELLLRNGVKTVQLLFNEFPEYGKALEDAKRIRNLCSANDALFIVCVYHQPQEALRLTLDSDADGMHYHLKSVALGLPLDEARRRLEGRIMGITAYDRISAETAETAGADYLGTDPIFPSLRHRPQNRPIGLEGLKDIIDSVRIPVIALGGIKPWNLPEIRKLGAHGFVTMSPVYSPAQGKTPESVIADYKAAWNGT